MKLDRTFEREIKKAANGDGSREARFEFLRRAKEAAKKMSTPEVMREFGNVLREYGRAVVGLCVAVTAWEHRDRLDDRTTRWAAEVLQLWANRPRDALCIYIDDGLHPTSIEVYAGYFIRDTTEEW